jgi:hypothetical protein
MRRDASLFVRFSGVPPPLFFRKSADHIDSEMVTGNSGADKCAKSAQRIERIEVRCCRRRLKVFESAAGRTVKTKKMIRAGMGKDKHVG